MSIESLKKILPQLEGQLYIDISEVPKINWDASKGSVLRDRRNSKNMNLEEFTIELAKHGFDYSKAYISLYEVGKQKAIKPEFLMAICEVLEANITEFVKARFLSH